MEASTPSDAGQDFFKLGKKFSKLFIKGWKCIFLSMMDCVDEVFEELVKVIQNCGDNIKHETERFPRLFEWIRQIVKYILLKGKIRAKEFIADYLDIELAFINTKHPEFTINEELLKVFNEDPNALNLPPSKLLSSSKEKLTNREKRDFCVIEALMDQYFRIVQKSIKDKVPKAIMKFLINYVTENLQSELYLSNPPNFDDLLVESENMTKRRQKASEMLEALENANDILSVIRNTDIF